MQKEWNISENTIEIKIFLIQIPFMILMLRNIDHL